MLKIESNHGGTYNLYYPAGGQSLQLTTGQLVEKLMEHEAACEKAVEDAKSRLAKIKALREEYQKMM